MYFDNLSVLVYAAFVGGMVCSILRAYRPSKRSLEAIGAAFVVALFFAVCLLLG